MGWGQSTLSVGDPSPWRKAQPDVKKTLKSAHVKVFLIQLTVTHLLNQRIDERDLFQDEEASTRYVCARSFATSCPIYTRDLKLSTTRQ
jgi:hypothetical protein